MHFQIGYPEAMRGSAKKRDAAFSPISQGIPTVPRKLLQENINENQNCSKEIMVPNRI